MPAPIDFHFDFSSPYGYLGAELIEAIASRLGRTVNWRPVLLGVIFTVLQAFEYSHAPFSFKDGIYPSVFFMATGFHGFHVIVGTIFLAVCLVRAIKGQFTPEKHFGFEAAAWYWHFVDVVWLFLFAVIYWWYAAAVTIG